MKLRRKMKMPKERDWGMIIILLLLGILLIMGIVRQPSDFEARVQLYQDTGY
jgi:hypothetical protein